MRKSGNCLLLVTLACLLSAPAGADTSPLDEYCTQGEERDGHDVHSCTYSENYYKSQALRLRNWVGPDQWASCESESESYRLMVYCLGRAAASGKPGA